MSQAEVADVLLVEDSEFDAEIAIRALVQGNAPHRIAWVRDGEEALAFLRCSSPPRLILLDIKMPRMDGLDFLRELQTCDTAHVVPVVVLTSSPQERDVVECYRLGASGFAVKPIDLEELESMVQRIGLYWLLVNRLPKT
jgi:two-component system, response regulator